MAQVQEATPQLRTARAMMPMEYDDTESFRSAHLGVGEKLEMSLPSDPRTPPFATYTWDTGTHFVAVTAVCSDRERFGTVIGAVDDLARTVRIVDDLAVGESPDVLRIEPGSDSASDALHPADHRPVRIGVQLAPQHASVRALPRRGAARRGPRRGRDLRLGPLLPAHRAAGRPSTSRRGRCSPRSPSRPSASSSARSSTAARTATPTCRPTWPARSTTSAPAHRHRPAHLRHRLGVGRARLRRVRLRVRHGRQPARRARRRPAAHPLRWDRLNPAPTRRIPILIGGQGERKTLRLVASTPTSGTPSPSSTTCPARSACCTSGAREEGRDPADIELSTGYSIRGFGPLLEEDGPNRLHALGFRLLIPAIDGPDYDLVAAAPAARVARSRERGLTAVGRVERPAATARASLERQPRRRTCNDLSPDSRARISVASSWRA